MNRVSYPGCRDDLNTDAEPRADPSNGIDGETRKDDEVPLMQRVAVLQPDAKAVPADANFPKTITADSLSVLLKQALDAGDEDLLEKALGMGTGNAKIRKKTLAHLGPVHISKLFKRLVNRLQVRGLSGSGLLPWITDTMVTNGSYLTTASGSREDLMKIRELADKHCSMLHPLLSLQGRLTALVYLTTNTGDSVDDGSKIAFKGDVQGVPVCTLASFIKGENQRVETAQPESDAEYSSETENEDADRLDIEDPYNLEAKTDKETDDEDDDDSMDVDSPEE